MDQNPLKQNADDITITNLRRLIQVQTDLRDQAERRAYEAILIFQDLLQTLAPEESERIARSGTSFESMPLSQLADLLKARSRQLVSDVARFQRPQIENAEEIIARAYTQNSFLRGELKRVQDQLDQMIVENNRLRSENEAYKKSKSKSVENGQETRGSRVNQEPVTQSRAIGGEGEQSWMQVWRNSKHFDQDSKAIVLLGKTGLSRRPEIEIELGKVLEVGENSGTQPRVIRRLEKEWGMVSIKKPFQTRGASSGGSNPDLIVLTDRGKYAYRILMGTDAVPSEFERLRPSHVSAEHTLLNIEVAEFLQQEGYTIMTEVPVIELPQGGKFIPDIVAEKGSEVYFIEVERGTSKDTKARQAKWLNFYTASAGQIYVFCDNLECMCGIRKELLDALGAHRASFSLTNMAQLKNGERGKDGSIWLDRRRGHAPQARHEPE